MKEKSQHTSWFYEQFWGDENQILFPKYLQIIICLLHFYYNQESIAGSLIQVTGKVEF